MVNPFDPNLQLVNDPDDFKLPYRLQSKTDIEVMQAKYNRLRKVSIGYIIRTGVAYG